MSIGSVLSRIKFWGIVTLLLATLGPSGTLAAPPSQAPPCAEEYVVQADDWLSKIADKLLGDMLAYPAIVAATNAQHTADASFDLISNPNLIEVGWKLCIPGPGEAENLLVETTGPPVEAGQVSIPAPPPVYTLDNFVAEFQFSPLVRPEWIYSAPDRVPQGEVLPEYQTRQERYGYRANYVWNELFMTEYYGKARAFSLYPPDLYLFHSSWQTIFPRYRYPASVTLPTRLTTNQFGWRGPEITLNKPRRTIRIACVGASTTVDGHSLPYSYPELLQYWLNLWSQEEGYNVKFEVINAGREGIGSKDIAAVVRYELLPMDLDYVIYYEGSNQFNVRTMVTYPPDVVFGQPPDGLVPNLSDVESADRTWLDDLSDYSALVARARSLVEILTLTGQEPPKPEQQFHVPAGLDEMNPDRARLDNVLDLNTILGDLDGIKQDLDDNDVKMFLSTFDWFVYDSLVLDVSRHRNLYGYLNRVYWPISYANMRRVADFQNRVFRRWAETNGVAVIDVAGAMPRQPDLYDDAIHNTPLGIRIRAWINFQTLLPVIKQDIENKTMPRAPRPPLKEHPYLAKEPYLQTFPLTNSP